MGMTAASALWLLPAVIPIAIYIAWNDMRSMKITNASVLALVFAYAIIGPFAFGLELYAWQWLHLPVALVVCMALWALRIMGGGDAKIIAAMSLFFMVADLLLITQIFAASLLGALAVHSLFRFTALKNIAPDWKSWTAGRYFPKGLPLSMTLLFYLLFVAFYR
ncbi:MAG: prepilin peptidase CpaA [Yoonia sp.]|jgi:prepilin peptidase CpaA